MNIVVLSRLRARLRELCAAIEVFDAGADVLPIEGGAEQLSEIPAHREPNVLIVDCSGEEGEGRSRLDMLRHIYPGAACILLVDRVDTEFLMSALRAGVHEVLPLPVNPTSLHETLARIVRQSGSGELRHGKIVACVACKGGGGNSFIAANLAYILAESRSKVLLLDLNLQFGDAALFVSDRQGGSTIADLATQIERVDAAFLAASVFNVTPDFAVLAAPENPAGAHLVKAEHIDTLLRLARHHYDFIVVDAGRGLDAVSIRALDHSDVIYPVLQLTLPFIRDGKRLLDAFAALDYGKDKIKVVVNRYQKGGDIGLEDLQRALGHGVAHVIPNQFGDVAASVNQGVPILKLSPGSPVTRALREIAASLAPALNATPAPGGWLSRLLRRP